MNNDVKAIKAGFWYTISNFLIRALSIISTPIFTRVMSVEDFGNYSNFVSWVTILSILMTLDLHATINRARFDFKDDIDNYISNILLVGIIIPILFYGLYFIFPQQINSYLGLNDFCVNMLFLNVIFSSSINIYQAKQRIDFEYKKSIFITFTTTIFTIILSLFLVSTMQNKLYGRIIGQTLPCIFINSIIILVLLKKIKKINFKYIKYSIKICLPYIPHLLAINILSQYDRIQIKQFCGANELGFYSLAYSCALIINIFLNSLNSAWSPWLGNKINEKKYNEIKKISKYYISLFFFISIGIFLISPEFLMLFGGQKYESAIYVMPPIIAGSVFQFLYTMYVNIEMFEKKMIGVTISTICAAISNVILNYIFIPKFGYISAAYTTLFCYILLFILHYLQVKRIKLDGLYSLKFNLFIGFCSLLMILVVYFLYLNVFLRYFVILLYIASIIYLIIKNKNVILHIIKKEK